MIVPQFNEYSANCLYCNTSCIISQEGKWNATVLVKKIQWYCNICNENFLIKGIEDFDIPDSFMFTCNGIVVYIHYQVDNIIITNKEKRAAQLVYLPMFKINFSDKEKLYNKLSTYLLFS